MEQHKSEIEKRSLDVEIRTLSEEDRVVEYVASTRGVDRYRTRVLGWNLDNYTKNPVVLWAHNKQMPPIGRAINVREDDEVLRANIQFAKKETYEFADTVYRLTRDGFLKGISAGFIPAERKFNKEMKAVDLLSNELVELSPVPVPGNADALTLALRDGIVPANHVELMTYNHAMNAHQIRGVEDIDKLRGEVMNWIENADPVQVQVPSSYELSAPSTEQPQTMAEESDETEALRAALAEQRGVIQTIAAMTEFDIRNLSEGDYNDFLSHVQAATERAGAVLNRANRGKLQQATDLINSVVNSAEKVAEDVAPEPEQEVAAPDDEKRSDDLSSIMDRFDEVLNKVTEMAHRSAGRNLVDKNTPTALSGDQTAWIDSVLARLPKD